MTTIVCDRKGMAADTRVTGVPMYYCAKVHRIRGKLVGVAGDSAATTKFLAWFRKECPADEMLLDVKDEDGDTGLMALVLDASGIYLYTNLTEPDRMYNKFYGVGTGAPYALGAIEKGATLREAIKIAMKYDEATGGEIHHEELDEKKGVKPRRQGKSKEEPAAPVVEKEPSGN
jgi:ATP-dependent protease HslVU (ClpYQ) peptidase subunit